MGSMHTNTLPDQIISDRENKIVTAPCYMFNTKISIIASEADKVIAELLSMM
jgi:enhancing lycopene biosynthesis protein 2